MKHKTNLFKALKIFLLVIVVANVVSTIYLLNQNHTSSTTLNDKYIPRISYLLAEALDNVSRPGVIDPKTNNVYLAQARLVLPPAPGSIGQVEYAYIPSSGNIQAEVQVANSSDAEMSRQAIINGQSLAAIYNAVPKAQACVRGISIFYQAQSGRDSAFTKKLANGQTIYLYTEPNCPDSNFLSYVEQINSY